MTDEYKIGYKKPPKHTRFKKGASGNPKGRPRKRRPTIAEAFERMLSRSIVDKSNGGSMTVLEGYVQQLFASSLKGSAKAQSMVLQLIQQLDSYRAKETALLTPEDQVLIDRAIRRRLKELGIYPTKKKDEE